MKKIHTLLSIDESKHEVALALIVIVILVIIVVILYLGLVVTLALIDLDPQKEFASYIHHHCLGLHTLIKQKLKLVFVMMYDVDTSYAIIQYVWI